MPLEDSSSSEDERAAQMPPAKPPSRYRKFLSTTAEDRYRLNRDNRPLILMKEYDLHHEALDVLRETLDSLHWQKLVVPPREVNRTFQRRRSSTMTQPRCRLEGDW